MNIHVAVLCDAATQDNGKLNLLGAFDTIHAQQLPAVHSQCTVALRLSFVPGDEGARMLKLLFVNADGRPITKPFNIPVDVAFPDDMHLMTQNIIVNMHQMQFDAAGSYSVDIRLDDRSQGSIPFSVRLIPRPGVGNGIAIRQF